MIEKVVVSMAQLNKTAGDLEGNFKRIAEAAEKAKHSDILVTPELSLCGYPPEDLLFLDSFLEDCAKKLNELVEYSTRFPKLHILAGYPLKEAGRLYNRCSSFPSSNGEALAIKRTCAPCSLACEGASGNQISSQILTPKRVSPTSNVQTSSPPGVK